MIGKSRYLPLRDRSYFVAKIEYINKSNVVNLKPSNCYGVFTDGQNREKSIYVFIAVLSIKINICGVNQRMILILLRHRLLKCRENLYFDTWNEIKEHVKRRHISFSCFSTALNCGPFAGNFEGITFF